MRLRYTGPALADLAAILDHIQLHAPQGARRVQRRIQAITELLVLHPGIGRRTEDPTIRRLSAGPYPDAVFYEIAGNEIILHAVRHLARDPSGLPGARS